MNTRLIKKCQDKSRRHGYRAVWLWLDADGALHMTISLPRGGGGIALYAITSTPDGPAAIGRTFDVPALRKTRRRCSMAAGCQSVCSQCEAHLAQFGEMVADGSVEHVVQD